MISAFTRRPVRRDVGDDGRDHAARARVCRSAGVQEKVLAAHRAGLTTVVMPKKNQKDMVKVPKKVQHDLTFHLVESMDEVLCGVGARATVARREPDFAARPAAHAARRAGGRERRRARPAAGR